MVFSYVLCLYYVCITLTFSIFSARRKCIVVTVHAGNTAAAPTSEVEAIMRSPTNMAAADFAAVEGRGHLALC